MFTPGIHGGIFPPENSHQKDRLWNLYRKTLPQSLKNYPEVKVSRVAHPLYIHVGINKEITLVKRKLAAG